MTSGLFGEGSTWLGWLSVDGHAGLQPRLAIKGQLIARSLGIGSVVSISRPYEGLRKLKPAHHLLDILPRTYVLNWVKQRIVQDNPMPPDETRWDTEIFLPVDTAIIEGLEERRQKGLPTDGHHDLDG